LRNWLAQLVHEHPDVFSREVWGFEPLSSHQKPFINLRGFFIFQIFEMTRKEGNLPMKEIENGINFSAHRGKHRKESPIILS
jgi:hypothetical protein